jgi:hypothetical protein
MKTVRALATIPVMALCLVACSDDKSATTATTATTTPATTAGAVQIDVVVGTDDSPTRVEAVPLGSAITLSITDAAAAETYHVHGYDLEQEVAAGETATFSFTADQAGTFEVESHTTETVLVVIEVS